MQLVFSWAPKLAKSVRVNIGFPVVRTDGGRSVYGHVITKFSRMGRLLHFLTHGAPLARFARESFAIIGTLRSEEGDGSENVAEKVNSRFFNLHRDYSKSLTLSNPRKIEFLRTISKFRNRQEISSSLVYFLCKGDVTRDDSQRRF